MISPRFWSFMLAMLPLATTVLAEAPCRIQVVEQGTEWPVPLVELRSVHGAKWFTDNAGVVALDAPELMGRESYFAIASDGYEFPSDGFGFAGIRITPRPGATHRIEVKRTAIARRVGRLTGAGLFAESQKVGQFSNWTESGLLGCDSVLSVEHAGDRYWIWGDSNLAHYPLGIFNCSAARTKVGALQWTEPPLQPSFDYFRDPKTMRPRGVVDIEGEGPVWLTGLVSLPAENHAAKLVATYMQVKPPLEVYRYGLCVWDESTETFLQWKLLWEKSEENPEPPLVPKGHPVRVEAATGEGTLLFGDPFPTLRCPASFEAWQDPEEWEPVVPQTQVPTSSADPKHIEPHAGSIAFNEKRQRWVTVFVQRFGEPSFLGEIWYAEADSPTGPWGPAVKILSHRNYSFYNPRLHAELTPEGSDTLLFEGTYTTLFTKHAEPTPRWDYNQVLYRLDLDDERLQPAQEQDN